jgi:chromosomal replication initiation ATPase DnaA
LQIDTQALRVAECVARGRGLKVRDLLRPSRGELDIARARQLAMYLVHVLLSRPQDVVGVLFGRDRTTVAHACRVMEDRRDDPAIEAEIASIEAALDAAGPEVRDAA